MKFSKIAAPLLLLIALPLLAAAPQSENLEFETLLTLRFAIDQALAKNLGLRIQNLDPEIAKEAVTAQEANFDPSIFSQINRSENDQDWTDKNGTLRQTTSESRSISLGVTKKLATGAQITASASQSRNNGSSYNPDLGQLVGGDLNARSSLGLSITQPLLRDFGRDVNLAPLRRAESQSRVADLRTRNAVLTLLQQIESNYWQLSDAYQRRDLSSSNLELSEKLLEEAQERALQGLATKIETLQAEANLAQRKEQIIRAEQRIREATDTLLASMGSLDESLEIAPVISVASLPNSTTPLRSFTDVRNTAFDRNFDTDIQEEVLEQLDQQRILDRNSEKPEIDVRLSTSYNGLSPVSSDDALSDALGREGDDWGIGLSFNLPWGSRSAKSNLRQTLFRIDQAELRLAEIRQDLLRSIRSAWRDVNTSRQQLSAAEMVVALQEATYEQERGKYDEGLSTFRVLLEAQRDLDNAKASLLDAKLATVQAEIVLARTEGTLLERHQIEWNETSPNAQ